MIARLKAEIKTLKALVLALRAENAELKTRLRMNSMNSSKPPSSDGYQKPAPKSRRSRSGKSPGKQPGAAGHHLAQVTNPDQTVVLTPERCETCGECLDESEVTGFIYRQVFDLPKPSPLFCIQYEAQRKRCSCGGEQAANFPASASAPTAYGPQLRALICYLSAYQHLPVARIVELLHDVHDLSVSTGTIVAILAEGSARLQPYVDEVREQFALAGVAHADETGLRVSSSLHWVHSLSTNNLTFYWLNQRRGGNAIDAEGIIETLPGVLCHDGYPSYRQFDELLHALCNAHHLRELIAAEENTSQAWPALMKEFLISTHALVCKARERGCAALSARETKRLFERYEEIIALGLIENPEPEPVKKRGRMKRTKTANLLRRLHTYQDDVLRFVTDFNVPFDNNLAERDLRMIKVHQKISGCFRSNEGAENFLTLRGYLSTARKNGAPLLATTESLFLGKPKLPTPAGLSP
jgi:transposase